jgi:hypothetical protein
MLSNSKNADAGPTFFPGIPTLMAFRHLALICEHQQLLG